MKRPIVVLLIVAFLFPLSLFAQQSDPATRLNVGWSLFFRPQVNSFSGTLETSDYEVGFNSDLAGFVGKTFGVQRDMNAHWYWGFTVNALRFRTETAFFQETVNGILLEPVVFEHQQLMGMTRLEVGRYFTSPDNRLRPAISLAVDPYYAFNSGRSNLLLQSHHWGVDIRVIPKLEFRIVDQLFLQAQIPIALVNLDWENQEVGETAVNPTRLSSSSFNTETFRFELQGGVGLSFRF
jgi:hypothetical protein